MKRFFLIIANILIYHAQTKNDSNYITYEKTSNNQIRCPNGCINGECIQNQCHCNFKENDYMYVGYDCSRQAVLLSNISRQEFLVNLKVVHFYLNLSLFSLNSTIDLLLQTNSDKVFYANQLDQDSFHRMDQQKSFYEGKEAILSFNVSEFTDYNNLTFQLYSKNAEDFESIYITLTERYQISLNLDGVQDKLDEQNQTQCTNNQNIDYEIKVNEEKNQQIETIQTIQIQIQFETEKLIIYLSLGLIIIIFSVALFLFWKIKFLLNDIGKNLTIQNSNIANGSEDDKKFYQEKCFICKSKLLNGKKIAQTPCKNEIHEKCLDLHNQSCLFCIEPNKPGI